jgi:hypothetical protein
MRAQRTLAFTAVIAILLFGMTMTLAAQDQINLGDGLLNSHFNGNKTPVVTLLIPSTNCTGGFCYFANGSANGTGHLASNGSYQVYSTSNSPFFLTHNSDDSFTVTQTSPINFSYTSPQGTLTGLLSMASVSSTSFNPIYNLPTSTITAVLTSAGGSFASYFSNGGNATIVVGLTFALQTLWQVNGFSTVEFQGGTIAPAGSCPPLTQGYWKNHTGAWNDGSGLTLGTSFYSNDQLENLLQTPVKGDASVDLAHQLIAALLNIDNGTTGIPVQSVINDANNLLGAGPIPENVKASSPIGQQMEGDAAVLDSYNSGQITNACSQ